MLYVLSLLALTGAQGSIWENLKYSCLDFEICYYYRKGDYVIKFGTFWQWQLNASEIMLTLKMLDSKCLQLDEMSIFLNVIFSFVKVRVFRSLCFV